MSIPGLLIRRSEPGDYLDLYRLYSSPGAMSGTLQTPYPSAEEWRTRLATIPEGRFNLVAVVDEHVIGMISVGMSVRPRRRHAGNIGTILALSEEEGATNECPGFTRRRNG